VYNIFEISVQKTTKQINKYIYRRLFSYVIKYSLLGFECTNNINKPQSLDMYMRHRVRVFYIITFSGLIVWNREHYNSVAMP